MATKFRSEATLKRSPVASAVAQARFYWSCSRSIHFPRNARAGRSSSGMQWIPAVHITRIPAAERLHGLAFMGALELDGLELHLWRRESGETLGVWLREDGTRLALVEAGLT